MIRNAKVHLELNLARDVNYDPKGLILHLSYISLEVAKGRLGKHGLTAESSGCPSDKGHRAGRVTESFLAQSLLLKPDSGGKRESGEGKIFLWSRRTRLDIL